MSNGSIAKQAFKTIEETSQNAVNEMRALIWQLKPVGLEQGLIHASQYIVNNAYTIKCKCRRFNRFI
ncbi:histidine kinase dimerization/phosphoacceptor domain-containing protein [Staphylococcus aureus]